MRCCNDDCVNLGHVDVRVTKAVASRMVDGWSINVCEACRRAIDRLDGARQAGPVVDPSSEVAS